MSTSAETRSAPPDDPPAAADPPAGTGTDPTRLRRAALAAGVVALLAALAFPFAPVQRPVATYRWPTGPAPTAASIPMLPYQPLTTTASVTGDAARATRGVLLATLPPDPDPATEPLAGLRIVSDGTQVTVTSGGRTLPAVALPPGPSRITVTATIPATTVTLEAGGRPVLVAGADGDVRPAVAGVFTTATRSDGLAFSAVGDTRFQTTITAVKIGVGVVGVLALAVLGVCLVRLDRLVRRRRRWFAERAWRPTLPDAAVTVLLAVWTVIGPITVDDGYIAGIVRARGTDGQVGTVFRWLNSPETPFGWFYEVLHGVAELSPAPLWLRLPSSVLGLVAWFLLTRAVLPRLRVLGGSRWTIWLVAVVFAAWWLPFDLSVRPEPWVVVGVLGVICLLERALAMRTVTPLVGAAGLAGITLAVTPTGVVAFTPFLAAAVPLARLARGRDRLLLVVGVVAALSATLLLVYLDQTWASVLDSVRIRTLMGGDLPWTDEYTRWNSLLTSGNADGNLAKRAPVLFTVAALVALAVTLGRARGIARGPARRIALLTAVSLAALAFTPTKWTHHFGAFAGVGTAVLVTALVVWARRGGVEETGRVLHRATAGTAVAAGLGGLVLAGWNQWHWLSDYAITWSTLAPQLGGIRFADALLVVGVVLTAGLGVAVVRHGLDPSRPAPPRVLLVAPGVVLVVIVGVVALETLSFARVSVQRRDSYTLASDSLAALHGRSCGLADRLRVETDPVAGLLTPVPGTTFAPEAPAVRPPAPVPGLEAAGVPVPGWVGGPDGVRTPWFARPRSDDPLVVTVTGPVTAGSSLVAQFGRVSGGTVVPTESVVLDEGRLSQFSESASTRAPDARDVRIDPAAGGNADAVRLVRAPSPMVSTFSMPRLPRTVGWNAVLPPGTPAATDWPSTFLFGCVPPSPLRDGLAARPDWRVTPDIGSAARSGFISYTASQGGPWATTRLLVREQLLPVYLPGLEMTDIAGLRRWVPVMPLTDPAVDASERTEWGWWTPGPLSDGAGGAPPPAR